MTGTDKDPKELLVELEYGELDERDATAAQATVAGDEHLTAMQEAIRAVRADLAAWDEVEPRPSRITFVAMPRRSFASMGRDLVNLAGRSHWTKAATIAASFVLGLLLSAAFLNSPLRDGGATGPATTAGPTAAEPTAGVTDRPASGRVDGAVPVSGSMSGGFRLMTDSEFDRLLESRLQQRGFMPRQQPGLSATADLSTVLAQLRADREAQIRALAREIVIASEQRQRQEVDDLVAGVFQTFDAQRTNDLLFLAGELGLLQENTGLELQRTQAAIDYLITIANERRSPEERNDD